MLAWKAGILIAGPNEDAAAAIARGDYATALRLLRPLAEQGLAVAQYNLGTMFEHGRGVPQDFAEAVKWYRVAADQGLSFAQLNLGNMYAEGKSVPQNFPAALNLFRLAAEQGNPRAQSNLGAMYFGGKGVPKDYTEALKWYRRAADQGQAATQSNLGAMYANGTGVPQDYVRAYMWFNLSAATGYQPAIKYRDTLAQRMTPAQIAEAQKLASEWRPGPSGIEPQNSGTPDDLRRAVLDVIIKGQDRAHLLGVRGGPAS